MKAILSVDSSTAKVTAQVDGTPVFLVQTDSGELLLPVEPGRNFGLKIENISGSVRAFPALVGDGTNWFNVFVGCPVTDPAKMPSTGGMWETRPDHTQNIRSFSLPGNRKQDFIAGNDGLGYNGVPADQIKVWERDPVDHNAVIPEAPSTGFNLFDQIFGGGAGSRSAPGAGATIKAGEIEDADRVVSDLDYVEVALELVHVRIVTREVAQRMFTSAGIPVDSWSDRRPPRGHWDHLTVTR